MEYKKILLYTGGAIVIGAVTYFVWSFFQKPNVALDKTNVISDDNQTNENKKDWAKYFSQLPTEFAPIKFESKYFK